MNCERLALILETATDGFWDWDLRADRLELSEGYRTLIGYPSGHTVFNSAFIESIVHPDDRPACVPVIRELMDGSRISATLEYRILRGDGATVWVQARGTAVDHDDAGRPARMVGTIFDITARKRSEEQLVLMGAVVDDATDEIFWVDRQGRLVYANRAACGNLGYSREELLAMSISDVDPLVPPGRWPTMWETVRLQGGFVMDSFHRTRDGRDIPKEVSVKYANVSGREIVYGFARDISERKRVEKALRTSEHRLRIMVEHLPAGAAHREENRLLVNRAVEEITGYRRHELDTLDKWFTTLHGEQAAEVRAVYEADRAAGMRFPRIMPLRRKDGTIRHIEFSATSTNRARSGSCTTSPTAGPPRRKSAGLTPTWKRGSGSAPPTWSRSATRSPTICGRRCGISPVTCGFSRTTTGTASTTPAATAWRASAGPR